MSEFEEVVICGETRQGRKFRPSDWAEHLCGLFATTGPDLRTRYSPYVFSVNRDGLACLVVSKRLQAEDPMVFKFLLDFARDNDLKVVAGRSRGRNKPLGE